MDFKKEKGGVKFELHPIVRQFLMTDDLVLMASASAAGKAYVDVIIPMCNAVAEGAEKEGMSLYNRDQMVQMFIAGSAWKEGVILKEIERMRGIFAVLRNSVAGGRVQNIYNGKIMALEQLEIFIKKNSDEKKTRRTESCVC